MKNLILISALIFAALLYSCDELNICDGMGYLEVENASLNTVQKLMIDGVSYGTLDPGETKKVSLAAGGHYWQLDGIVYGGCSAAYVIIVECETSSYECRGK
jgi:hypothetical protein